jgi:predicted DNA-binding transcriptional regulator AlpA
MQFTPTHIGFVGLAEILTVLPIGKASWWDGIKSGRFPKPAKSAAGGAAWRAEDIRELVKRIWNVRT